MYYAKASPRDQELPKSGCIVERLKTDKCVQPQKCTTRISGKGVHKYKGVGVRFADFI